MAGGEGRSPGDQTGSSPETRLINHAPVTGGATAALSPYPFLYSQLFFFRPAPPYPAGCLHLKLNLGQQMLTSQHVAIPGRSMKEVNILGVIA